jgi:D-arabinose 1-dehydrogenase-like Zn-dependent alcohol dehydrogenase
LLISLLRDYSADRVVIQFRPKAFESHDVDVEIEACGVCGSDVHTLTGGWGQANFRLCVGHEVVGHVVNIGKEVSSTKVGDRVGVGAQVWACLKCKLLLLYLSLTSLLVRDYVRRFRPFKA